MMLKAKWSVWSANWLVSDFFPHRVSPVPIHTVNSIWSDRVSGNRWQWACKLDEIKRMATLAALFAYITRLTAFFRVLYAAFDKQLMRLFLSLSSHDYDLSFVPRWQTRTWTSIPTKYSCIHMTNANMSIYRKGIGGILTVDIPNMVKG